MFRPEWNESAFNLNNRIGLSLRAYKNMGRTRFWDYSVKDFFEEVCSSDFSQ